MKDKYGIGQRLLELRQTFSLNQSQMADLLDLTRSGLSQVETGVTAASVSLIYATVSRFDIGVNWLLLGEGEMFASIDSEHVTFAARRLGYHDALIRDKDPDSFKNLIKTFVRVYREQEEEGRNLALNDLNDIRGTFLFVDLGRKMGSLSSSPNSSLNPENKINRVEKDYIEPVSNTPISIRTEFIVATQDTSGNPTYSVINHKAAANYLSGYESQEYYESLGVVTLPRALVGSPKQGVFLQIEGDSMTPKFQHGDWVACTLLDRSEWHTVRDLDCYVVVSTTYGIQFKRVKNRLAHLGFLRCKSDNRRHRAYNIEEENLLQLFRFVLHVSPDASNPEDALYQKVDHLEDTTTDLRQLYEQMQEQIQALTDTQKPIKPKEKAH